ncbi:MAG: FGGY family carbohydrate kinase [Treponema sp.]|nr:FGGY family carbohydrate kinase [Treponema sp.]
MLLTVDIGTSAFKAAVWDGERRAGFASVPLSMSSAEGLRHEADGAQWLRAFSDCCRLLRRELPLQALRAMVVSGNGPSLVPVLGPPSASGVPAAPARLWLDRRALGAAERLAEVAGIFVDPSFSLPKALDIRDGEPELYRRTRFFLGCPEFLAFFLTGQARTVFPAEGLERWFWTEGILAALDLDPAKFPPFIRPGERFGELLPERAAEAGLPAGIPVISGGSDFVAAILGTGTVVPGAACNRTGTSDGINACTEAEPAGSALMCYRHPIIPFNNVSGTVPTTGKAIQWARGILGIACHREFFALAETAGIGSGGTLFVPHLAGTRTGPRSGSFRGLNLSSGRAELARAVLEGIGFALREILTEMEGAGIAVGELRLSGKSAGNDFLCQLRADLTGKPVLVGTQPESELLGLAIIGAHALGEYGSLAEAAGALARIGKTFLPVRENTERYGELFAGYRECLDR